MILEKEGKKLLENEILSTSLKIFLINTIYREKLINENEYFKIKEKILNCKSAIFF